MDYYKNRKIDFAKPVEVYRNLRSKKYLYSIRQDRIVRAHTNDLTLVNCKFKVIESGRLRVVKSKHKNVHAFIKGFLTSSSVQGRVILTKVRYNPYEHSSFVTTHGNDVVASDLVVFSEAGVFARI